MQVNLAASAIVLAVTFAPAARAQDAGSTPPDLFAPSNEYLFSDHAAPGYHFDTAAEHVSSIPWLTGGIFAGTFVIGVLDWEWGSTDFHFASEGFFGEDTFNGGMDKLGHAFGTYLLTDIFKVAHWLTAV